MSASESLSPTQFYHGSSTGGLSEITPRGAAHYYPGEHEGTHAFATTDASDAWDYAEKAWNTADSGVPHVYRVEPMGDVERDPHEQNYDGKWWRSRQGFKVLGEEKMPEHMGDPEDWR